MIPLGPTAETELNMPDVTTDVEIPTSASPEASTTTEATPIQRYPQRTHKGLDRYIEHN